MPFWRPEFLLLLGLTLAFLQFSPTAWRKPLLTLAGLYFYAWWDLRFVPLLAGAALADWALALWMERTPTGKRAPLFVAGLALHLGLLAFFKYADFFLNAPAGSTLWLIMPLGLSFQTFSAITYLAAVQAGRLAARRNPVDVLCFATFFPVLTAGPIVRAEELLPQLDALPRPGADDLYEGFRRFSMGLFKKLVLADRLGLYVAEVYGNAGAYDAASTWAAVLAYALQIYLDFSGYSDMAIGAARALGVRLPENFSFPYAAKNPSEFWRRWHMSLSFWFRDYLYIPLGGSRQGEARTLGNLMVVMVLCGMWHGSGWTFVLWGALHGLGLCAHRLWREWRGRRGHSGFSAALAWAGATLFAGLCWIPFRADDLGHARRIVAALFAGGPVHWIHPFVWVALALTVLAHGLRGLGQEDLLMLRGGRWYAPAVLFSLAWLAILFASEGFTPFLYARF
ncbi:MAG: MBOAT family O-acyltransferase [Humidesulfovibrio sp.]|uniref:MBOAT family O-acyltransferase n=1 Tax=Humidesulfovibrio sp. TaxID=2910988 RepID=UPI0027F77B2F|nr:MBOAT family O-acyltransferase [Humidesulfovibrio sp.]MDQ7834278.1 MBOAT family O-acyltransferase [Humidesulfovibrio sp.]